MAVTYTKKDQNKTITTGTGVPSHSAIAGDEYTDTISGIHYIYTTSWVPLSTSTGGLTYFIETGNTVSPNTTVPVVALIANSGVTNVDVAIVSKGSGSFMLSIPDNNLTGGDKRGTRAVDLQTQRNSSNQVASGNNSVIAGGLNNRAIGGASFTSGESNISGGASSIAIGQLNTSNGFASTAIGYGNSTAYDGNYAIGYSNSLTSGPSGNNSFVFAFGLGNTVNASNAVAIGSYGLTNGVAGRQTFSGGRIATNGDAQKSTFFYRGRTTDATLTTIATDGGNSINNGNSMQLANNSAIRFKGTIIGKQSGSNNTAAWDVDGLIVRGASASATALVVGNVNLVSNTPNWGTPVLSAYIDAFNGVGALRIQIQGAVGTNIQWTGIIDTTEVIYA